MTQFALPAPSQPSLEINDSDLRFAVRRIYCVGRNYADHAREMGHDPNAEPPFFFTKPASAIAQSGQTLPFPKATDNLHHEAELVVAIGKQGSDIARDDALGHVFGYATGNDLTRRDLQNEAKDKRRPWDMSKGFDSSAIIGPLFTSESIDHPTSAKITATVDGVIKQDANISDMIWPVPDVVAYLSKLVTLEPGDLIMTGTPAGVGPIKNGQTCTITIEGLGTATVSYG